MRHDMEARNLKHQVQANWEQKQAFSLGYMYGFPKGRGKGREEGNERDT